MAKVTTDLLTVTPSQLKRLLMSAIPDKQKVLIVGAPGVGKTEIVSQAAAAVGADYMRTNPGIEDPTVAAGLPWPDKDNHTATFLPFGTLAKAMKAEKLTVWCPDDFGQASPAVQAAYMPLLLDGQINGNKISENVVFVATTNDRTHKAGVTGLLEPVKDRFDLIVQLRADLEDSCAFFMANNMPSQLVAFLRNRPDLLSAFEPTSEITKSPSPRGWFKCGKWVEKSISGKLDADLQLIAFAGCVGQGAGLELKGDLELMLSNEMPDCEELLRHPKKAKIPSKPAVMYAVVTKLAYLADEKTFPSIYTYALMLHADKKAEFATILLRDCIRRCPALIKTKEFDLLENTALGKLIIAS